MLTPVTPRRSTRRPLATRKNVLATTTPSSRRGQTSKQVTVKANPIDVKPIIISDDEDVKPSLTYTPSVRPGSSTAKRSQTSQHDVILSSPSGSRFRREEVKAERTAAFTLDSLTKELDDIASTLEHESQSTPSQAAIADLFSADSPDYKPDPWSSPPVSPHSPLRDDRVSRIAESPAEEEAGEDEPELLPAFWGDEPGSSMADVDDTIHDHRPTVPFTPRSAASRSRFEKLQSLVQARQTPTTSRRARRPTNVKSEMSEQSEEGDSERTSPTGAYDLERHYDTSLGSLRDFIVSDSDVSDGEIEPIAIFVDSDSDEGEGEGEGEEGVSKGRRSPDRTCSHDSPDDDFDVTDGGVLVYSPVNKTVRLPDLSELYLGSSDEEPGSSRRRTPARRSKPEPLQPTPRSRKTDSNWTKTRERIAQAMFDDLNRRVFEGKLAEATIEWNKRLLTTAGVAKGTR
jgi:hypothetical protein